MSRHITHTGHPGIGIRCSSSYIGEATVYWRLGNDFSYRWETTCELLGSGKFAERPRAEETDKQEDTKVMIDVPLDIVAQAVGMFNRSRAAYRVINLGENLL